MMLPGFPSLIGAASGPQINELAYSDLLTTGTFNTAAKAFAFPDDGVHRAPNAGEKRWAVVIGMFILDNDPVNTVTLTGVSAANKLYDERGVAGSFTPTLVVYVYEAPVSGRDGTGKWPVEFSVGTGSFCMGAALYFVYATEDLSPVVGNSYSVVGSSPSVFASTTAYGEDTYGFAFYINQNGSANTITEGWVGGRLTGSTENIDTLTNEWCGSLASAALLAPHVSTVSSNETQTNAIFGVFFLGFSL